MNRGVLSRSCESAFGDPQNKQLIVRFDANTSSLVSIHADQNIIFHSLASGEPSRQIVGFNDEIIDATFLSTAASSSHTHLALATNSNLIRLYSTTTFDVRLLSGHKDMVLSLDKSIDYRWLASGSKDHTARIWSSTDNGDWRCLAVCEGHAEAVGGVALSRKMDDRGKSGRFLMTASQDRTIKMWDLTSLPLDDIPDQPLKPRSLATIRAHEKDINALDLAPNDRFLASGSQDKLVKIYEVDFNPGQGGAVRHVGTCKGHKRGVWTVKFSRTDRIVASGAADRTIRIWSLDDYSCLKTFEGHTNSVLRLDFLSAGMQLVTSSSDGLVKLWNIKDEECVKTLDNHEDKVGDMRESFEVSKLMTLDLGYRSL
jgi:U3 small nucleolar RNA-associated protein 13